jgi:xanthine/CO dehydrogenase XdhC/CoxF family maturation factor
MSYEHELGPLFATSVETLRERSKGGHTCDCCGGRVKVYRRKLNSGMAATLIWLVVHRGTEWTHTSLLPRFSAQSNEISKLMFWRLVDNQPNLDSAKKTSGVWRATDEGVLFVQRRDSRVPSHVFVRSPGNSLLGFESDTVTAREALGKKFDYAELMAGR